MKRVLFTLAGILTCSCQAEEETASSITPLAAPKQVPAPESLHLIAHMP